MDGNETLSEKRDKADESWADFVRKGKYFYGDHLTAPAFLQLLGCVREKEVLDLACGEGVNARLLARKGAKVTAVDFSRKLIALAIQREKKAPLGIRYCVSEASCLSMSSSAKFDVVICYMAL